MKSPSCRRGEEGEHLKIFQGKLRKTKGRKEKGAENLSKAGKMKENLDEKQLINFLSSKIATN